MLVSPVAVNVNVIVLDDEVPPFVNLAPLPSTAEVIVVSGGIGEVVLEITETVGTAVSPELVTYMLLLAESKAISNGP